MNNKSIADHFNLFAKLLNLKKASSFKVRSYENAYNRLRKYPEPLSNLSLDELQEIDGVGSAIAKKIKVLVESGSLPQIEELKDEIPGGVQELLNIRGLGASKIRRLWLDNDVTSPEKLKKICEDKSILDLKGFGEKTRVKLLKELEFYLDSHHKMLYAEAYQIHNEILEELKDEAASIHLTGDMRRAMPIVSEIEWLVVDAGENFQSLLKKYGDMEMVDNALKVNLHDVSIALHVSFVEEENIEKELFYSTGGSLIEEWKPEWEESAEQTFAKAGKPFIVPEMRDLDAQQIPEKDISEELVTLDDIKGVIHSHTDWSDGIHTLKQMVEGARNLGYEYLLITDHSKAAFYANGLDEERIDQQIQEIDKLNAELDDFRILKGIECDILQDGSMDLSDSCLSQLDVVIASIHSGLSMDKEKATDRILAAVEHQHVHMLGHPSGRLLLSREGYPLDYEKIIDACSKHNVAIEVNANPKRLDIDWKYLPYCIENDVSISINPDAHSIQNIDLIQYGVLAARKGGLKKKDCINTYDVDSFLDTLY